MHSSSPPTEQRQTIQTGAQLFGRASSYSASSIRTDTISDDFGRASINDTQKIILQTAAPRAEVHGKEVPAKLVYSTSYGGKMEFELVREETTLGRRDDNHICLSDGKISKHHAIVVKTGEAYSVKDKNSSNGVRVNGKKIVVPESRVYLEFSLAFYCISITFI